MTASREIVGKILNNAFALFACMLLIFLTSSHRLIAGSGKRGISWCDDQRGGIETTTMLAASALVSRENVGMSSQTFVY